MLTLLCKSWGFLLWSLATFPGLFLLEMDPVGWFTYANVSAGKIGSVGKRTLGIEQQQWEAAKKPSRACRIILGLGKSRLLFFWGTKSSVLFSSWRTFVPLWWWDNVCLICKNIWYKARNNPLSHGLLGLQLLMNLCSILGPNSELLFPEFSRLIVHKVCFKSCKDSQLDSICWVLDKWYWSPQHLGIYQKFQITYASSPSVTFRAVRLQE